MDEKVLDPIIRDLINKCESKKRRDQLKEIVKGCPSQRYSFLHLTNNGNLYIIPINDRGDDDFKMFIPRTDEEENFGKRTASINDRAIVCDFVPVTNLVIIHSLLSTKSFQVSPGHYDIAILSNRVNHYLSIYDLDGNYVGKYEAGEFNCPTKLEVSNGLLVVEDRNNSRIVRLSDRFI